MQSYSPPDLVFATMVGELWVRDYLLDDVKIEHAL